VRRLTRPSRVARRRYASTAATSSLSGAAHETRDDTRETSAHETAHDRRPRKRRTHSSAESTRLDLTRLGLT
jgi:hypothetical protein